MCTRLLLLIVSGAQVSSRFVANQTKVLRRAKYTSARFPAAMSLRTSEASFALAVHNKVHWDGDIESTEDAIDAIRPITL